MKKGPQALQWSRDQKLLALMRLPWDVHVEQELDGSWSAHVTEIRDAIATADKGDDWEQRLGADLWESLHASLAVRLDHRDPIPLPEGHALPWLGNAPPPVLEVETPALQRESQPYQAKIAPPMAAGEKFEPRFALAST